MFVCGFSPFAMIINLLMRTNVRTPRGRQKGDGNFRVFLLGL